MKLQFKYQKFQADATNAVCDVFAGQPYLTSIDIIVKTNPIVIIDEPHCLIK